MTSEPPGSPMNKSIRSFFGRVFSQYDREERGYPPQDGRDNNAVNTERPLTVATTDFSALVPNEDKLLVFRTLTGIDTAPALKNGGNSIRMAPNIGIYCRVLQSEEVAKRNYKLFSVLTNLCLGLQVLVGAIITALGAAKGSHQAITGFGAINTVVATILTYIKGSDMPGQLKHRQQEWKRIRQHIEQREREFCLTGCQMDVYEEILKVEEMHRRIKSQYTTGKHPIPYVSDDPRRPKTIAGLPLATPLEVAKQPERSSSPPMPEKSARYS